MKHNGPYERPVADRFCAKVPDQPGDDCWEWQGARDPNGYGRINYRIPGGPHRAHLASRVSYMLCKGDPIGLNVCHACDNPPCVNPSHLFLGTQSDNMTDSARKGRHAKPHAKKTHCPKGHPYSPENTGIHKRGHRYCRTCAREATINWKLANKGL